jgi:D-lactate dehydrogenase
VNILYLYREEWEKEYFSSRMAGHSISFFESLEKTPTDILNAAEALSVFISHPVQKTDLAKMPNLKLIATRSTGFDHIDLKAAAEKNISVVYVPFYGENTVAEFAFALLLTLSRKIYHAHNRLLEKGLFSSSDLQGFDLKGKTIGIVGTGRIGVNMIRIASGFNMNIIAFDPFPKQDLLNDSRFRYVSFEELLRESDVISLHSPLNEHTHHMINKDNIHQMKKGVFIINTARGGLIETTALEEALEEGIIAGAGLDVLEEEKDMSDEMSLLNNPSPKIEELKNVLANHYLIRHLRVIVTPHIAFNTTEAIYRILDTTTENINSFARGEIKNSVPRN